jgi:hypothetical protein
MSTILLGTPLQFVPSTHHYSLAFIGHVIYQQVITILEFLRNYFETNVLVLLKPPTLDL